MAKYTLELRTLENNLFDFDYPYYEEEAKCYFEEKFLNHYYFHEIGFETIARFKQQLRSYLLRVMPYYQQLYEIELRCKDIDFMLNKDLKETFIRELEENEINNLLTSQNETGNTSTNINNNESNNSNNNTKESSLADGVSSSKIADGYLTNSSQSTDTYDGNSSTISKTDNKSNLNINNTGDKNNKQKEKTELISQGNIGVTSSAELKEKWQSCLNNIDEKIILGARSLFMYVY